MGNSAEKRMAERHPFPKASTKTQCFFCFWNPRDPDEIRLHNVSTTYKTRDHVELDLKQFKVGGDIPCSDPECQKGVVRSEQGGYF
jgi:hypothetical protein